MHSTEWGRCGNSWGDKRISHQEWLGGYESSRVIVTTQMMKKELMRIYSLPEGKINVIPNGIVSGKMRKRVDPGGVKRKYKIRAGALVVLFCGRMSYQKGPDLLVEAIPLILKRHKGARFIFAGEGEMRSRCEDIAQRLKVSYACRFLGYVSGQEKEGLMNACDLLCVPSRNEPFGMGRLEAWDAGKPVVATEAVSIINNFQNGLLAYIQPESLAWCINRLLDNPGEMNKLAKAGHERTESEFNWDEIAKGIEAVYDTARA
jgi:glycosyltransferase involved in cell wall biosynthesis